MDPPAVESRYLVTNLSCTSISGEIHAVVASEVGAPTLTRYRTHRQ